MMVLPPPSLTESWFYFHLNLTSNGFVGRSEGRVLEVRANWEGARIVAAAVYQHVWSAAKTLQANKDDRARVLAALSKVVKQVPKWDSLMVAGDFNTSVHSHPALVGQRVITPAELRPDEADLTNLLVKLRLVALNTWQCPVCPTFVQGREKNANRLRPG